jgi:hypothetical protein
VSNPIVTEFFLDDTCLGVVAMYSLAYHWLLTNGPVGLVSIGLYSNIYRV